MRFTSLDGWRGICALAVALFHLNVSSHVYEVSFVRNSYLFVDFFFVLSGFVIAGSYRGRLVDGPSAGSFIIRRFGRLWPLHVLMLSAFVGFELLKLLAVHAGVPANTPAFWNGNSVEAILPNAALIQSLGIYDQLTWNVPSWSISCEFYTYCVFLVLTLMFGRFRGGLHLVFLAVAVASVAIVATFSGHGQDTTYDFGFFRCLSGFFCGALIHALRVEYDGLITPPAATPLETAAAGLAVVFVSIAGRSSLSFLAPMVFSIVVFVFSYQAGSMSRLLSHAAFQRMGDYSYSIYMVHFFIIVNVINRPINIFERKFHLSLTSEVAGLHGVELGSDIKKIITLAGPFQADLLTLAYLCLVVAVSALLHRWFEVPFRNSFNAYASARFSSRVKTPA